MGLNRTKRGGWKEILPVNVDISYALYCTVYAGSYTAKTKYRKFETNIPRKGIVRPQFQFPHSCVCERILWSQDRSAYSAAGKFVDWSREYINRLRTHDCGNWNWGRAIPFLWRHKWDFVTTQNLAVTSLYWYSWINDQRSVYNVVFVLCKIIFEKPYLS